MAKQLDWGWTMRNDITNWRFFFGVWYLLHLLILLFALSYSSGCRMSVLDLNSRRNSAIDSGGSGLAATPLAQPAPPLVSYEPWWASEALWIGVATAGAAISGSVWNARDRRKYHKA